MSQKYLNKSFDISPHPILHTLLGCITLWTVPLLSSYCQIFERALDSVRFK